MDLGTPVQCRFCLEEGDSANLLSPCGCSGTARFVHSACLRRWQQETNDNRAYRCQVCHALFFQSRPLLRGLHTNPRYDRRVSSRLPSGLQDSLLKQMKPGFLVVQTPHCGNNPCLEAMDCVSGFFSRASRACGGVGPLPSRMADWRRGVFLLCFRAPCMALDGGHVLVGVNLNGRLPLSDQREATEVFDMETFWEPACLVQAFHGGPVCADRFFGLLIFEGVSPSSWSAAVFEALGEGIAHDIEVSVGVMPLMSEAIGCMVFADVVTLRHILRALRRLKQPPRFSNALAFRGCAVWSSGQLMSEVAQGMWSIAGAQAEDIESASSDPSGKTPDRIWTQLWSAESRRTPNFV